MRFLKCDYTIARVSPGYNCNSQYVTLTSGSAGYTCSVVIPWQVRLYRFIRYQYRPLTTKQVDWARCTVSGMGNTPINNSYSVMYDKGLGRIDISKSNMGYRNAANYNDIPNTTVYNESVAGGYSNQIQVEYFDSDDTPTQPTVGFSDRISMIFCFEDDDPVYDDMLANYGTGIEVYTGDTVETTAGVTEHWWIANDGTPPYLNMWKNFYAPYHICVGDDSVTAVYRGDTQIFDIYVGSNKL